MKIEEKSSKMKDLIKANRFEEALELYRKEVKPNFSVDVVREDKYLVSEILYVFYKTSKYLDALNFVKNLGISLDAEMLNFGLRMYGWSIYQLLKQIKKSLSSSEESDTDIFPDGNHHEGRKRLNNLLVSEAIKILSVLSLEEEKNYLLVSKLFFMLADFFNSQPNENREEFIELIGKIPYQSFHRNGYSKIINGRTRQFASDFERWYLITCKSYYITGNYEKCIQNGNEAINAISQFVNNNDVWIKRFIALSYFKLEKFSEAIRIYEEDIILKKDDWFLYKELAEMYLKINNLDMALKYSINAALVKGELIYKCNLFQQIGEILLQRGEIELGQKHILLNYFIRDNNNWKISEDLSKQIGNFHISYKDNDLDSLQQQVKKYWESFLVSGVITKTIPQKRIGWIKRDNQEYFFRFALTPDSPQRIREGQNVLFLIGKGYDRKTNQIKDKVKYFRIVK